MQSPFYFQNYHFLWKVSIAPISVTHIFINMTITTYSDTYSWEKYTVCRMISKSNLLSFSILYATKSYKVAYVIRQKFPILKPVM